MIDFTSCLYLGMQHARDELPAWQQLTTGVPPALYEAPAARRLAQQVAGLQGMEAGLAAPSTLHLYWDLYGWLRSLPVTLFIDEQVYPVATCGLERLQGSSTQVYRFPHQDAQRLSVLIKQQTRSTTFPVVVTDGWCPACGAPAPLKAYQALLQPLGGMLVIDDTQALGILGKPSPGRPYGTGGGGLLQWLGISGTRHLLISSLAKAFGVPMAVLSGSEQQVKTFEHASEVRTHAGGVSHAHLAAAGHALYLNQAEGDTRRQQLWYNHSLLYRLVPAQWLQGGLFPVQSVAGISGAQAVALFHFLQRRQIRTALVTSPVTQQPVLSFVLRCNHHTAEMVQLAAAINAGINSLRVPVTPQRKH